MRSFSADGWLEGAIRRPGPEAKTSGLLPLEADGINVIQGLAIGKGVFYRFEEMQVPCHLLNLVGHERHKGERTRSAD